MSMPDSRFTTTLSNGRRLIAQTTSDTEPRGIHIMCEVDDGSLAAVASITENPDECGLETIAWATPHSPIPDVTLAFDVNAPEPVEDDMRPDLSGIGAAVDEMSEQAKLLVSDIARERRLRIVRDLKPGDYVIYHPCDDRTEIGRVLRRTNSNTGWFVFYSSGETAASTPDELLYPIDNAYALHDLGGERARHEFGEAN